MIQEHHKVGYCTNVHAGTTLGETKTNLEKFSCQVAKNLGVDQLGVGLWLAHPAAAELVSNENALDDFADWLRQRGLSVFTLNGFPFDNFHQTVVKHKVYHPTWWQAERLEYTLDLGKILSRLVPKGEVGSISTLPIAWSSPKPSNTQIDATVLHLKKVADEFHRIYEATGREIVLAIEPEPGCWLGDSSSLRIFLQRHFLRDAAAERYRKHITVCHDICHAAVMREDQRREIQSYRELGIRIGKVQVSSAIEVDWNQLLPEERPEAFEQLSAFAEDRYLHQTSTRSGPVGSVRLNEDLSKLISGVKSPDRLVGNWCVHFHVPIFLKSFGKLLSTQSEIKTCLTALAKSEAASRFFTGHFEVETYAWNVLPNELRPADLSQGIADELRYFKDLLAA